MPLPPEWDGSTDYRRGDRVAIGGSRFFEASEDIPGSALAFLGGGDKPGSSSKWRELPASTFLGHGGHGGGRRGAAGYGGLLYDGPIVYNPLEIVDEDELPLLVSVPGEEVMIGAFDFNVEQAKMNGLRTVPLSVARVLLKNAQWAIDHAMSVAASKNSIVTGPFPGASSRNEVAGKVNWHAANLNTFAGKLPETNYPSGDDLKKWTLLAFREANAADEGAATIDQAWSQMWTDVAQAIAALPAQARAAVAAGVGWLTGVPLWGWALGAVGVAGLLGWGVYKLANTQAGAAAAGGFAGRWRR